MIIFLVDERLLQKFTGYEGSCILDDACHVCCCSRLREGWLKLASQRMPPRATDKTNTRTQNLAKEPTGVVVCCLDVLVGLSEV